MKEIQNYFSVLGIVKDCERKLIIIAVMVGIVLSNYFFVDVSALRAGVESSVSTSKSNSTQYRAL